LAVISQLSVTAIIDPVLTPDYSWRDAPSMSHELPCETGLHFWTIEGFARTYRAFGSCFACEASKLSAQSCRIFKRRRNLAALFALIAGCLSFTAPAFMVAFAISLWIFLAADKRAHTSQTQTTCRNLDCLQPVHMDYQSALERTRLKLTAKYRDVETIAWHKISGYSHRAGWKVMCVGVSGKAREVIDVLRKGGRAEIVYRAGLLRLRIAAEDVRSCIAVRN
jgi:hypothetical protein